MRTCVIYVIGVTRNPVKIGHAASITARLSSLQVGCPDELVVHYTVRCPPHFGKKIEAAAHEELAPHNRRGEWFNIDAAEALEVVQRHAARFIEMGKEVAGHHGDLLARLAATYTLDPDVRSAEAVYRDLMHKRSGQKFIAAAQGYILKVAGKTALNVFRLYMEEAIGLFPAFDTDAKLREAAEVQLVRALNALADYRAYCSERRILAVAAA